MNNRTRVPPLSSLRAFEATARQGSMTRAAAELGVTQSAISHQVRNLEAITNVRLLERRGNRFTLTQAGLQAMNSLGEGFEMLANAVSNLGAEGISGDVVLSCPPALTSLWLVRSIGTFLSDNAGIRLRLRSSTQWDDVISADIDLCIRYGSGVIKNRQATLLSKVDLFPVCSPSLAASMGDVRDLLSAPLLYAIEDNEWTSWFASAGVNGFPTRRHYMDNDLATIEASVGGCGVAMGDNVTCRQYLDSGLLVAPFDTKCRSKSAFFLIQSRSQRNRLAVTCMRDWIISKFKVNGGTAS